MIVVIGIILILACITKLLTFLSINKIEWEELSEIESMPSEEFKKAIVLLICIESVAEFVAGVYLLFY